MKTRYRLAVWAVMAVVGSTIVGGGFWVWLIGIVIGKFVARLALTAVVAIAVYLLVYTLIFGGPPLLGDGKFLFCGQRWQPKHRRAGSVPRVQLS